MEESSMTPQSFIKAVNRIATRYDDPKWQSDKNHHEVKRRYVGHPEILSILIWDRKQGYSGILCIHNKEVLKAGNYTTARAVRDNFTAYIKGYLMTEDFVTDCLAQYGFQHCHGRRQGYTSQQIQGGK
jgi:hypothetical protein